jgi:PKD repeat protein
VCFPDIVNFTNLTPPIQGYQTTYLWDFDDGQTSNLYSPSHTYISPGVYNVTMTAHVVGTNCTDNANCEVEVYDIPIIPGIISHD